MVQNIKSYLGVTLLSLICISFKTYAAEATKIETLVEYTQAPDEDYAKRLYWIFVSGEREFGGNTGFIQLLGAASNKDDPGELSGYDQIIIEYNEVYCYWAGNRPCSFYGLLKGEKGFIKHNFSPVETKHSQNDDAAQAKNPSRTFVENIEHILRAVRKPNLISGDQFFLKDFSITKTNGRDEPKREETYKVSFKVVEKLP